MGIRHGIGFLESSPLASVYEDVYKCHNISLELHSFLFQMHVFYSSLTFFVDTGNNYSGEIRLSDCFTFTFLVYNRLRVASTEPYDSKNGI